ncbi:ATP-dependent zinc metalloprotease FTSH 10, mitochondrial-like [Olea europaea subsp. europaea]|uniref:ATP-dependent zinc metalloprotease FTSH 10, mitochondrial-like n=1 Tax=Olea europaea subsp. europaea TaxID=158383 RepID=A0A8S0Q9L9_OLEEU|nr:ATP-dependent zinc metalloprotease FTSH 10, mitochondrial-like [Olea europaea subsp. europaea]
MSAMEIGIERQSSIEKEPLTLNIDQIQFAREAALYVMNNRSIEEALRIFTKISFQEFKNKLLELGLVDHIVIFNKSVAKVYVKSSPPYNNQTSIDMIRGPIGDANGRKDVSHCKFYSTIGSVESFKGKLEEIQEVLGIDPHNYVPVTLI